MNKITFEFTAELIYRGPYRGAWSDKIAKQVLDWYTLYTYDFKEDYPNMTLEYLGACKYRGSYDLPGEISDRYDAVLELKTFVDPDEDGNHPLTVNGSEYGVMGTLTAVNGKKI